MKKINQLIVFLFWFSLLVLLQTAGCKNDSTCYQGRVELINNGAGCPNILTIEKTIAGGLPVNTSINFYSDSLNISVKEGDILDFTIVKYEEWTSPVLAICLTPQYSAQIEICSL